MNFIHTWKISKGFCDSEGFLKSIYLTVTIADENDASNTKDFIYPFGFSTPVDANITWETLENTTDILGTNFFSFIRICQLECEILWAGDTVNNLDIPYEEE